MPAYLKRLDIAGVEEVGVDTTGTAYLKRVEIVEVVDQNGNPWEPVPGPDPWDDLVVVDKAQWSDGNVYAVGETISGVSATFTGGTDEIVYRSRTQHRPYGSNTWINSSWTNHTNTPQVVQFTIPAGEEGGEVRFQTQARDNGVDPVDQVNSFASIQQIDFADLAVVQRTSTSGNVLVGSTLTGTLATYTGGEPPVTEEYQWQRSNTGDGGWTGITNWTATESQSNTGLTYITTNNDLLKYVRFASKATDNNSDIAYGSGNSVGPIEDYKEFGTITIKINDIDYDYGTAAPLTILMNDPITAAVTITGNAQPTYTWDARNDYPLMVGSQTASTVLTFPQEGAPTVTCTLIDSSTIVGAVSITMNFYVVDAFD